MLSWQLQWGQHSRQNALKCQDPVLTCQVRTTPKCGSLRVSLLVLFYLVFDPQKTRAKKELVLILGIICLAFVRQFYYHVRTLEPWQFLTP